MSGQGQQQNKGGNKPMQAPMGMQTQQQYMGPAGSAASRPGMPMGGGQMGNGPGSGFAPIDVPTPVTFGGGQAGGNAGPWGQMPMAGSNPSAAGGFSGGAAPVGNLMGGMGGPYAPTNPQQTPVGGYGGPTSSFDAKWQSQGFGGGMAPPDMRIGPRDYDRQGLLDAYRAGNPVNQPNRTGQTPQAAMQRPQTGGVDPLAPEFLHGDPMGRMGGMQDPMRRQRGLMGY